MAIQPQRQPYPIDFTVRKLTVTGTDATKTGILLPQINDAAKPTLAFGDGDSGLYESADDNIGIAISGAKKGNISATGVTSEGGGGGALVWGAASATVPAHTFVGDLNTGIGQAAADNLSLIAGGLEGVRVEDPADLATTETSLYVFDDDNNTLEQVTVGAADSGGSGYKLLRIAN